MANLYLKCQQKWLKQIFFFYWLKFQTVTTNRISATIPTKIDTTNTQKAFCKIVVKNIKNFKKGDKIAHQTEAYIPAQLFESNI